MGVTRWVCGCSEPPRRSDSGLILLSALEKSSFLIFFIYLHIFMFSRCFLFLLCRSLPNAPKTKWKLRTAKNVCCRRAKNVCRRGKTVYWWFSISNSWKNITLCQQIKNEYSRWTNNSDSCAATPVNFVQIYKTEGNNHNRKASGKKKFPDIPESRVCVGSRVMDFLCSHNSESCKAN